MNFICKFYRFEKRPVHIYTYTTWVLDKFNVDHFMFLCDDKFPTYIYEMLQHNAFNLFSLYEFHDHEQLIPYLLYASRRIFKAQIWDLFHASTWAKDGYSNIHANNSLGLISCGLVFSFCETFRTEDL